MVPGSFAILKRGDQTIWTVHETLRKGFHTTGPTRSPTPSRSHVPAAHDRYNAVASLTQGRCVVVRHVRQLSRTYPTATRCDNGT